MRQWKALFSLCLFFCSIHLSCYEKIYFLHIPKTGGTTICSLLEDAYPFQETRGEGPLLNSYSYHHTFAEIKDRIPEYKVITFLRDPIDRVISEHHFSISRYSLNPYALIAHFLPPLGDPIETAKNVVCKILSGLEDPNGEIPIEVHLEHAKETLAKKCYFVGITEKMEESITLLFSALKWPIPDGIPRHNQTGSSRNEYSQAVLEEIARRNWADIALYEFALDLFESQKEGIVLNKRDNSIKTSEDLPISSDYEYTFDQKLDGSGWCLREVWDENTIYRWIDSSNDATLYFPLACEKSYELQCRVFMQPLFLDQMRILINGIPIKHRFDIPPRVKSPFLIFVNRELLLQKPHSFEELNAPIEFTWVEFSATIPKVLIKAGEKTKLSFQIVPPVLEIAREIFETTPLGLPFANYVRGKCAFSRIELKSID